VWEEFKGILSTAEHGNRGLRPVERFQFYDLAAEAVTVVSTAESAAYGNLILTKGLVIDGQVVNVAKKE